MFSCQTQNWRHPQWRYSSDVRVFLARMCMSLQMQFLAKVRSNSETSHIFEMLLGVATLTGPFLMTIGTFLLLLQLVMHSQWIWIIVLKKIISLRPSFLLASCSWYDYNNVDIPLSWSIASFILFIHGILLLQKFPDIQSTPQKSHRPG